MKEIKMNVLSPDVMEQMMYDRGYSLTARSGSVNDYYIIHMVKTDDSSGIHIFAEIDIRKGSVTLSSIIKTIQITTGAFDIKHRDFDRLFERRIVLATVGASEYL